MPNACVSRSHSFRFFKSKSALLALGLTSLVLMSGCSSINPDFMDMTEAYERSIDMHQKKSLLANMLRASNNLPLMFTDITTVAGTGSISTASAVDGKILASNPGSIAGFFTPSLGSSFGLGTGLSTNRSFTFSLGSLNNEEFYSGFLTDTPLEDMHFYMRSDNPPKEFVAALLVDSIEVTAKNGTRKIYLNDPFSPDYKHFQSMIYQLLDDGLTTEMNNELVDIGPALSKDDFTKILPEISKIVQAKVQVRKVGTHPETFQLSMIQPKAKFCMDSPSALRHWGQHMDCDSTPNFPPKVRDAKTSDPSVVEETMMIRLRSTKSVFRFLGKLIALQSGPNPVVTMIRVQTANGQFEQKPIIVVKKGAPPPADRLIATTNYQGTQYSVSLDESGYSARVFDLLSVMVTMNKITGSIPASPGVLIR